MGALDGPRLDTYCVLSTAYFVSSAEGDIFWRSPAVLKAIAQIAVLSHASRSLLTNCQIPRQRHCLRNTHYALRLPYQPPHHRGGGQEYGQHCRGQADGLGQDTEEQGQGDDAKE